MTRITPVDKNSATFSLLQPTTQVAPDAVQLRKTGARLGRRMPNSTNQRPHADRSPGSPVDQMRTMKDALGMTTRQLSLEMQVFEKEHKSHIFKRSAGNEPICQPITQVILSAYLQGWVIKDEYIKSMLKRVKDFYDFKLKSSTDLKKPKDMVGIMNSWFDRLGIDYKDPSISPARSLANAIAPFYKRPVLAKATGKFVLGEKSSDGYTQSYSVITNSGEILEFNDLSTKDKILAKNGSKIEIGQTLQFAVLYLASATDKKGKRKFEPSKDHTTFYRWYRENKLPRTQMTLQLVEAAVDLAEKNLKG